MHQARTYAFRDCGGKSAGILIFLGGFKVQWHTLSRWFANVEIEVRLLMPCGMLLSPQYLMGDN